MNRPGSKLKPIAPKPPAQGGPAAAGSSSTAAGHQAPAADAAGGQAAAGSVAGAIVQATPGQHPTMQQHPGQAVSPIPTAAPYPGGPQPAFPGHGPPYALPFPVPNHSPQPAYMMHPAGTPVSSHPGAPIIYPAGPQPMPANAAPATASTQDYVWGTPADEAGGASRPTTPPPLQLTAGPSSGQPQPTAVAHGQIMHPQRFPVSAAPGAQYPGMMMSYFPGQVSPMPMPMPVAMQMGQQGPTIYQHGGPAPNQFIQTSVALQPQPQPHIMALPASSSPSPSKKAQTKKQQKAQAQAQAQAQVQAKAQPQPQPQPQPQAVSAPQPSAATGTNGASPASSGTPKPSSHSAGQQQQGTSQAKSSQQGKQQVAGSSQFSFEHEIDLDETLKDILDSEAGVRDIGAADPPKQENEQQQGAAKATTPSDESTNTGEGGSPLMDGMKESDTGYGLTGTNDVDAHLEDIYGMQTAGLSGLNEEDLDLDFVTLEVDMGDCTDITSTSMLTHQCRSLKKAKSMLTFPGGQSPADDTLLMNIPAENAFNAISTFLRKSKLPEQERNSALKAIQALQHAHGEDASDRPHIPGTKKRAAAA